MRTLLVVALVGCGASSPPVAPSNSSPGKAVTLPTDAASLHQFLEPLSSARFDGKAIANGCPPDQTIGEYVALLERGGNAPDEIGDPTDKFALEGGCGPFPGNLLAMDPPADPAYVFCKLDSSRVDAAGESPWNYALDLRVRKSDGVIDTATFACPGA